MDRFWCALGGAALHLPAMARTRRAERPCDTALGPRRRVGDRYRCLLDRQDARWPEARTSLEPAKDLGGARRRRGMRRARRLGDSDMARDFSGLAAGAPQRGPCDCRAVRRSCRISGQTQVRRERLERSNTRPRRPTRQARRPTRRHSSRGAADHNCRPQRRNMAMTMPAHTGARDGGARRVTILGSTGSVGQNTVDLLLRNREAFEVEALTANRNPDRLAEQARPLRARLAAIHDPAHYPALKQALAGTGIETACGAQAVVEAALRPAEWVMAAIVGAAGLAPTLAAIQRGAIVALANKEALVCAGTLVLQGGNRRQP